MLKKNYRESYIWKQTPLYLYFEKRRVKGWGWGQAGWWGWAGRATRAGQKGKAAGAIDKHGRQGAGRRDVIYYLNQATGGSIVLRNSLEHNNNKGGA